MASAPPPLTFWKTITTSVGDALTSTPWWKQQSWIIVTEILMGFLAAWGLVQSIPGMWIGVGLGLVYAINAWTLKEFRQRGRIAGIAAMILALVVVGITGWLGGIGRWMGLCFGIGVLLGFRDYQSVHSMAWIPVRALRRGNSSLNSLTITAIMSAILLAMGLAASGWISHLWKWWPHLLVLIAFGVFVPEMIMRMGKGITHASPHSKATHAHEITWLLKLGVAFNAVNFLGRRLLIPAMIVKVASSQGSGDMVMPILGASLGVVGILGALARAPVVLVGSMQPMSLLKWGARLSLVGWGTLARGLLAWTWNWLPYPMVLIPILLGWAMLEFTNRTWSIAYMEQLRCSTVGTRLSAARAHRRSLHKFMVRKSAGASVGCAVGGLLTPALAPAAVLFLLLGCWFILERHPHSLDME